MAYHSITQAGEGCTMYELHGWMVIRPSPYDYDDHEASEATQAIQSDASQFVGQHHELVKVWMCNGRPMLVIQASRNHRHDVYLDFLRKAAQMAPGSYGIIYVHDPEDEVSSNRERFVVWRIARGKVERFDDGLLSPMVPVIEDPSPPTIDLILPQDVSLPELISRSSKWKRYLKHVGGEIQVCSPGSRWCISIWRLSDTTSLVRDLKSRIEGVDSFAEQPQYSYYTVEYRTPFPMFKNFLADILVMVGGRLQHCWMALEHGEVVRCDNVLRLLLNDVDWDWRQQQLPEEVQGP